METILVNWINVYHPDTIIELDINKCLFVKNGHLHFVLWELSGIEAIHLIDDEIKQVIKLDYDALSAIFKNYLEKNY